MSKESETNVLKNGNNNILYENGSPKPKRRLFDFTTETSTDNYPQKLGEQDLNQSNHVGVIVWCLVFTIIAVKFALYIGK